MPVATWLLPFRSLWILGGPDYACQLGPPCGGGKRCKPQAERLTPTGVSQVPLLSRTPRRDGAAATLFHTTAGSQVLNKMLPEGEEAQLEGTPDMMTQ